VECSGELTIGTEYTVELTGKSMGELYVLQARHPHTHRNAAEMARGPTLRPTRHALTFFLSGAGLWNCIRRFRQQA